MTDKIYKQIMIACEKTWNNKTCREIRQTLSQKPTGWIHVSEKLPEDDCQKQILATIQTRSRIAVRSGRYENGLYMLDNGDTWTNKDKEVTAWMPIEPYKESEE